MAHLLKHFRRLRIAGIEHSGQVPLRFLVSEFTEIRVLPLDTIAATLHTHHPLTQLNVSEITEVHVLPLITVSPALCTDITHSLS